MQKLSTLVIATAIAAITACSGEKPAETTTAATPPPAAAPAPAPAPAPEAAPAPAAVPAGDPVAEADAIMNTRCAACHGAAGKGDGVAAAALNPKPRDYTDKAWQASVDDAYLTKVILEGGAAVGKSPLMTANADLKDKPEVVKALVAKIRSYGK